jgi:3-mercaptopyruvate sulfurtransferase SseA
MRTCPLFQTALTIAACLCLSLSVLTGCNQGNTDKDLKFISVSEGQDIVKGKSSMLGLGAKSSGAWVDPRTEAEYKAGHIPGAINLPYEHLAQQHKKLEIYDTIVVYGDDYADPKAKAFSKRLISDYNCKDVRTLLGGLREWKAEGNELEVSTP